MRFAAVVLAGGLWFALPPAPALHAQQKIADVAQQLNLTPQQKLQLAPVLASEAPKVKAIKGDATISPLQKMERLREVRAQTDPMVKSILTPDQYQKLQSIRREEVRQMMMNRQGR